MRSHQVVETEALILQRTPYSESDWVVCLFAECSGKISAITPGARKSKRRYAGGLEPFHGLTVQLRSPSRGELFQLQSSEIAHPRHNLVSNLNAMRSAACVFRWLRRALPPMVADSEAWSLTQTWLDALDNVPPNSSRLADARSAEFGLRLLSLLGWALQLERCVRCEKSCPSNRPAYLNLAAGGIVCRACGGSGLILDPTLRAQLLSLDDNPLLGDESGPNVLRIVDDAFALHAGIDKTQTR